MTLDAKAIIFVALVPDRPWASEYDASFLLSISIKMFNWHLKLNMTQRNRDVALPVCPDTHVHLPRVNKWHQNQPRSSSLKLKSPHYIFSFLHSSPLNLTAIIFISALKIPLKPSSSLFFMASAIVQAMLIVWLGHCCSQLLGLFVPFLLKCPLPPSQFPQNSQNDLFRM